MSGPRPLQEPAPTGDPRTDGVRRLVAIIDRLRDPDGGCAWDLEQTLESIAPHHVEEACELVEAVEIGADAEIAEEAGDLLMGIVLQARIAEQAGRFDLTEVCRAVCEKLVRRHPHVFGDARADSAGEALSNWEAIKREERAEKGEDASALAGVPAGMPALQRIGRLGTKAIAAGFRWPDASGAMAKLREEVGELDAAMESGDGAAIEAELGDVLLAAALLGPYLSLEPERAARLAARRFEARFRAMEGDLAAPLSAHPLEELMAAWRNVKARAAQPPGGGGA